MSSSVRPDTDTSGDNASSYKGGSNTPSTQTNAQANVQTNAQTNAQTKEELIGAQLNHILFSDRPMDMTAIIAEFHAWCEAVQTDTTAMQEFLSYMGRHLAARGHGRLGVSKAISIAICVLSSKLTPSKLALQRVKETCERVIAELISLCSAYRPTSRSKDRDLILKVRATLTLVVNT